MRKVIKYPEFKDKATHMKICKMLPKHYLQENLKF